MAATGSIPEILELIEYHGNGIYVVPSATHENVSYTVNLNTEYCNCPATVMCWHVRVCKIRHAKARQEVNELMRDKTTETPAAPEYPMLDSEHGAPDWTGMLDYYIAILDYVRQLREGKARLPYASTDDKRRLKRWEDKIQDYTKMADGMWTMLRKGGLDVRAMEEARRKETGNERPAPTGEAAAERERRHAKERVRRGKEADEAFAGRVQNVRS